MNGWSLTFVLLLTFGCSLDDTGGKPCPMERPDRNEERVSIGEGVWGDVWFWSGDFMPICESGEVRPAVREVRIHELTSGDDVDRDSSGFYSAIHTPLAASTHSDESGFFEIELPPGRYSIFVMEGDRYYSNRRDGQGNFWPVQVDAGRVTSVRFDITYDATS